MSDVEKFWEAISAKMGVQRKWHQLDQMEQMQFVQGINLILAVVHN
jgi:hypothetical protein